MDFFDELQSHFIPGDGAMGTLLLDSGVPRERCLEALCVSQPELVLSIHASYIAAGSRLIRTNSFGANAVRLEKHGFATRINEINWTAARLGRDAARGKPVFVAGSVGPLGITAGEATAQGIDRNAVFQEQIGALLDGGVDLIFFETFQDFDELALALNIKHSLHHCPAICSLACPPEGKLASGMTFADACAALIERGADVVGLNCIEPGDIFRLLSDAPSASVGSAFPSAGLPEDRAGRLIYQLTPEAFAEAGWNLVERGVRLVGGCCGTRPEHIAALTERKI